MDVLTPSQRSYNMARIPGKNTVPELALRRALWGEGLRFRVHYRLPGRPDIVFPRHKVAVFVDGCFWHRCPLHSSAPKINSAFWEKKISGNCARDAKVNDTLRLMGWKVVRFWEHEIKRELPKAVRKVSRTLKSRG
ncbi:MAG: very short patch repair endonuclease [Alphaproteobacteria bacterium]|nr:very short patch repair endonuclease [Alphaproteobacteria bacterium]